MEDRHDYDLSCVHTSTHLQQSILRDWLSVRTLRRKCSAHSSAPKAGVAAPDGLLPSVCVIVVLDHRPHQAEARLGDDREVHLDLQAPIPECGSKISAHLWSCDRMTTRQSLSDKAHQPHSLLIGVLQSCSMSRTWSGPHAEAFTSAGSSAWWDSMYCEASGKRRCTRCQKLTVKVPFSAYLRAGSSSAPCKYPNNRRLNN